MLRGVLRNRVRKKALKLVIHDDISNKLDNLIRDNYHITDLKIEVWTNQSIDDRSAAFGEEDFSLLTHLYSKIDQYNEIVREYQVSSEKYNAEMTLREEIERSCRLAINSLDQPSTEALQEKESTDKWRGPEVE